MAKLNDHSSLIGVASEPGIAEVISRQLVRLRDTRPGLSAVSVSNHEI